MLLGHFAGLWVKKVSVAMTAQKIKVQSVLECLALFTESGH